MRYQEICEAIEDGRVFALSRWGDGEWHCVRGRTERTAMGSVRSNSSHALRQVLRITKAKPYHLAVQTEIKRSVRWAKLEAGHQNWDDADALHKQSPVDELRRLLVALSGVHVVFIGNAIHRDPLFIDEFIEVARTRHG